MRVSRAEVEEAARKACRGHERRRDVREMRSGWDARVDAIYTAIVEGDYKRLIRYSHSSVRNRNGKVRNISSPDLTTRVLQYVFMGKILPLYDRRDNGMAYNCKKGRGLNARRKKGSFVHAVKHLYYDMRQLGWAACMDQRKCYEHVRTRVFRKALKGLTDDAALVRLGVDVTMHEGRLPIGTPISPLAHHIVMLGYDEWARKEFPFAVRYADNVLIGCESRQEAHAAMWRTRMKWWYELGVRSNRKECRVVSLDRGGTDVCGTVYYRNADRTATRHDKGYARVRRSTADAARKATVKNWPCYFGQMADADCYGLMRKIEDGNMELTRLTDRIRIDRSLDAPHVEMRELDGRELTVLDYEIRRNGRGADNWVKLLVCYDVRTEDGNAVKAVRETHGDYAGIHRFLRAVERVYRRDEFLPIEHAVIVNECGYIFKGSTNQIKLLEEYDSKKVCGAAG